MSRLSLDMTTVRIPTATDRLQFNKNFTFRQAREIVTYLHHLGISDAYASPYFHAGAESLHGYDITDHNKFNAAIGSREDYDAWVAELHAHGMGQIADFVPNHMGINDPQNVWWQDVLENCTSSLYAPYFDIDWRPLKSDLHDKVLLPILGDQYGRVLERGELRVRFDGGSFSLTYFDHVFPIAPGTYRYILELALENLAEFREEDFYAEFQSILTALEYLPRRTETDPERIKERAREKEIIKKRLERRCAEAPQVQRAIEKAVETINGHIGDPRSFDRLDELLNAQSYRLAFWRVAAEEINYRRFFDVNDLAAIRVELPKVLDAVHRFLLELVSAGAVTGLRIDHPDGLYLPGEYFEKLQQRCGKALGIALPKDGRAIYMVAEKILTGSEGLRNDWRLHGTTGYDFANQVTQLLVDSSAEEAITKTFHRFIGRSVPFGHLLYAKKLQVMKLALANDVDVLGNMLDRLSERRRWKRTINDAEAPDANEECLLYQTLLGTWPMRATGELEPVPSAEYVERIQAYMAKALHEAKINTSWIQPNEEWDAAVGTFVAKILDPSAQNKFLPIFLPVAQEIARLGAVNSLTQTLLKLTSPGVPDIYQGTEIWDYSLVDPDNRRPVDYAQRREMLETLETAKPDDLMHAWPDGRIKMFLTQRVLRFRREHADLFQRGEYLPLLAGGIFAECCVGFARYLADEWIAVIAPRLSSRLGFPPLGDLWKDTAIEFPENISLAQAHDLFSCRPVRMHGRQVKLADILATLPFAVITNL